MSASEPPQDTSGPYREGAPRLELEAEREPVGPYPQLAELAAAHGAKHAGEPRISFEKENVSFTVSLEFNSGTVSGLTVRVARRGLPEVLLRTESPIDVQGKMAGLNVEAETGDASFDDDVYIETEIPEEAVKKLLSSSEARGAVLSLLRRFDRIKLSPEGISVTTSDMELVDPARFHPVLEALLVLAKLPAVRVASGEEIYPRGQTLVAATAILGPFAAACLILLTVLFAPEENMLLFLGAGVGFLGWGALRPLFTRAVRGHSKSLRYFGTLTAVSFVVLPIMGMGLAVSINALLDGSTPEARSGRVESVRHFKDDDDHDRAEATVKWSDGTTSTHDFTGDRDHIARGNKVKMVRKRGLFGYRWVQTDAMLDTGEP